MPGPDHGGFGGANGTRAAEAQRYGAVSCEWAAGRPGRALDPAFVRTTGAEVAPAAGGTGPAGLAVDAPAYDQGIALDPHASSISTGGGWPLSGIERGPVKRSQDTSEWILPAYDGGPFPGRLVRKPGDSPSARGSIRA